MPITRDMSILKVILKHPCTERVFAAHGMACATCMAADETVETGAQMHSVDVQRLLSELNQAITAQGEPAGSTE